MDTVILADWLSARLDRSSPEPMYRQLLQQMQQAILTGELGPGTKLPSSRTLAADLSIARNTVLHVYDQLTAEGYVLTTTGSGTYVADTRPDAAAIHVPGAAPPPSSADEPPLPDAQGGLSMRGRQLIEHAGVSRRQWGAFMPGVPDVSEFPSRTWSRLQARLWKEANPELLTYAPGGGYRPLRRALADYLRVARSVKCSPDQVIITTGIHQSIDLAVRLLSDIGDRAWVEEPCYWGVRSVLQAAGLTLTPVPVDQSARPACQRHAASAAARARHAVASVPARDGDEPRATPDAARIRAPAPLLDHRGRLRQRVPLRQPPARIAAGADDGGRVIYVGSLGKMLFPGLRMGYMVVPEHLVDTFRTGLSELYREGQLMQQAVLAEFIMDGHLTSHVRRMRTLYGERRQLMIDAIRARFGDALPVMGDEAGLHLVLGLPDACDDRAVTQSAFDAGVIVRPLTSYYSSLDTARRGLLLGYACVPHEGIGPAFDTLANTIERHLPRDLTRAA